MIRQFNLTLVLGCKGGLRRDKVEIAVWSGSNGFGRLVTCMGIEAVCEGKLGFGKVEQIVVEFVMLLRLLSDRKAIFGQEGRSNRDCTLFY